MQRSSTFRHQSEEEVKQAGLVLDFDEIARKGSMCAGRSPPRSGMASYSSQPGHHKPAS